MSDEKIISVVGLRYIGLPTAALLASRGYKVKVLIPIQTYLKQS